MQEALEAHCLCAQELSGNLPCVDSVSADKGLEMDSMGDSAANFRTSKCPQLNGMCICNCMIFCSVGVHTNQFHAGRDWNLKRQQQEDQWEAQRNGEEWGDQKED